MLACLYIFWVLLAPYHWISLNDHQLLKNFIKRTTKGGLKRLKTQLKLVEHQFCCDGIEKRWSVCLRGTSRKYCNWKLTGFGKWVLKENDIDWRLPEELIVIAEMGRHLNFIFSDWMVMSSWCSLLLFSAEYVSLQVVVPKMLFITNCLVPNCAPSSKNGLKNVGTTKGRSIIVY